MYEEIVVMKKMVMENGPNQCLGMGSHRKWLQGPTVKRLHPAKDAHF